MAEGEQEKLLGLGTLEVGWHRCSVSVARWCENKCVKCVPFTQILSHNNIIILVLVLQHLSIRIGSCDLEGKATTKIRPSVTFTM